MSEENGKQPMKNRLLQEAYSALVNLMRVERLPIHSVKSRLALNRNSLRPLVEALEESQQAIQKEQKCLVGPGGAITIADDDVRTPNARFQRTLAFRQALKLLGDGQTDWRPVATIELRKFPEVDALDGNDLAVLIEAGVIIGDPAPDETPDKKR